MCGIVGILGDHEVGPLLVNALKRLEYRGYDSAGIATLNDGKLGRRRSLGKLAELSDLLVCDPIQGKSGDGQRLLLHLLHGVCVPLGHSDCQHADLGGYVLHDQEAVC